MNKVVIIGSGCSALAACYSLSKNKNNKITLITADDSLGKKYLVTGNGRCNFTNLHMNENCYYGNSEFIFRTLVTGCILEESVLYPNWA